MAELIRKEDTLNDGRIKLNNAITDAEQAKNTAGQADSKASQALAKSESTQTQLDTIVIEGDSSVEAAQARVDAEGTVYGTLKQRLDTEHADVTSQLAHEAKKIKTLSDASRFKQSDIEILHNLLKSGEGIRYAVLGDSTEVGIRNGEEPYGEIRNIRDYSGQTLFALSLMMNDDNFIAPDKRAYEVKMPLDNPAFATSTIIDSHRLLSSYNPKVNYDIRQQGYLYNEFTVYYLERTSDSAATFDIELTDGVAIETKEVDTYTSPINFNDTNKNVDLRLQSATVPIPNSAREFSVSIKNVSPKDRGNGVSPDATAIIVGFTLGKGVKFKNLAVSSTTLLNDSEANLSRGITTDERFQKAFDFGANVFSIGFGTNDSKPDVTTVEDFKADFENRIDQIRNYNSDAIIILNTDPAGASGSDYKNNTAFNEVIRKVALDKDVNLLDIEYLFSKLKRSEIVADSVHPNAKGYLTIGEAYSKLTNTSFLYWKNTALSIKENNLFYSVEIPGGANNSDYSGGMVDVAFVEFNRPYDKRGFIVDVKLNCADTIDIDSQYDILLEGYSLPNFQGTKTTATLDQTYVSVVADSGTRTALAILKAIREFGTASSYRVILKGKNYRFRNSGGRNVMLVSFI